MTEEQCTSLLQKIKEDDVKMLNEMIGVFDIDPNLIVSFFYNFR